MNNKFYLLRTILIYGLFISTYGLQSCNKFLEKKSNNSLVTPTNLSDLQALLDENVQMNNSSSSLGETACDDYFLAQDRLNALIVNYQELYLWRLHQYTDGDWLYTSRPIYICNLVLERIKNIENNAGNLNAYNNVIGSALFFRSYYFLSLLWDYGKAYDGSTAKTDLGIMLRTNSDFNVNFQRASVQDCYDFIIKDVKKSISLLPNFPQIQTRPSKIAAYGLLARTYLSMRDYRNALLYADSCLNLKSDLLDFNDPDEVAIASTASFTQFNNETILFSTFAQTPYGFFMPSKPGYVDTTVYSSFDENDLRKQAYFRPDGSGYYIFKGSYSTKNNLEIFTGLATDEMYLIRAECYIRTGQVNLGLNDLNKLLSTRWKTGTYTPVYNLNAEDALELVLKERRKEMIYRGTRWSDIKRLNKEGYNINLIRKAGDEVYKLEAGSSYFALPFPSDLIKITGIQQN